jgi:hypothetical protein
MNLAERARAAVDHNDDVVRKRAHLSERRFEEWMSEQEQFVRHYEKIEKKAQEMEKKMKKTLEGKKDKNEQH